MTIFDAVGSGFTSFFSIWQVCILQISPFFLAWVTGLYFAATPMQANTSLKGRVLLPALAFAPGFTAVYALLTMTGLPLGRVLVYNLDPLGFVAGFYILLASLSLLLAGRISVIQNLRHGKILALVSLLLGSSFALIYSPCITPALSEILGMARRPETTLAGGTLAFFYGLGICLALTLTAVALVFLLSRVAVLMRHAARVRYTCALVLGVLAGLNLSDTMIYYKAFFLGFLAG